MKLCWKTSQVKLDKFGTGKFKNSNHRNDLANSVKSVIINFESMTDNRKRDILLYGDSCFDVNKNKFILQATINYLKNSERFSGSLFE